MGKTRILQTFALASFQDRLRPGRMLLVDLEEKQIEEDERLKMQIALSRNHKKLTVNRLYLDQIRKDDVVSCWQLGELLLANIVLNFIVYF